MPKLIPNADLSNSVQYLFIWLTALNHLNIHRFKAVKPEKQVQ